MANPLRPLAHHKVIEVAKATGEGSDELPHGCRELLISEQDATP